MGDSIVKQMALKKPTQTAHKKTKQTFQLKKGMRQSYWEIKLESKIRRNRNPETKDVLQGE